VSQGTYDHSAAMVAIQTICRTMSGGAAESAASLRAAIQPTHLNERGYQEMPWIAREMRFLIKQDPQLRRTFQSTFSF